jgi:hypothetical protein
MMLAGTTAVKPLLIRFDPSLTNGAIAPVEDTVKDTLETTRTDIAEEQFSNNEPVGRTAPGNDRFLPFERARAFVRGLQLKSDGPWQRYSKLAG